MKTSRLAMLILILAGMLIGQAVFAEDVVKVTADNYVRAETDYQVKTYVEGLGCFGKFIHSSEALRCRQPDSPSEPIGTRSTRLEYLT